MIEQLVARVFAARNITHLAHWKTKSGYHHIVLGEFYDQVIEDIDAIVECYQGAFGKIGDVPYNQAPTKASVLQYLESEVKWIEENSEMIAKENCSVENLIDTLCGTYNSTIFKLRDLI